MSGWASARDEATEFFAGNYKASQGKFHVTEGYVETVIPLARDLPALQELDLNAAVRATGLLDLRLRHDLEGRFDVAADRRSAFPLYALTRHSCAKPRRVVHGRPNGFGQRGDQSHATNGVSAIQTATRSPEATRISSLKKRTQRASAW